MAMKSSRLRARGQITMPSQLLEDCHLQVGDEIEFEPRPEGILMRPRRKIDLTQAWFWSQRWQAMERQAEADLQAGRIETFETDEDFAESLEARMPQGQRERVET